MAAKRHWTTKKSLVVKSMGAVALIGFGMAVLGRERFHAESWAEVPCAVTMAGRPIQAPVFQSREGTLLVDLGNLGYLVQPFYGVVRVLPNDKYRIWLGRAIVHPAWPQSTELAPDEVTGVTVDLKTDHDSISFNGFGNVRIVVKGNVTSPFEDAPY